MQSVHSRTINVLIMLYAAAHPYSICVYIHENWRQLLDQIGADISQQFNFKTQSMSSAQFNLLAALLFAK